MTIVSRPSPRDASASKNIFIWDKVPNLCKCAPTHQLYLLPTLDDPIRLIDLGLYNPLLGQMTQIWVGGVGWSQTFINHRFYSIFDHYIRLKVHLFTQMGGHAEILKE